MEIDWGMVAENTVSGALLLVGQIFVQAPWVPVLLVGVLVLAYFANKPRRRRRR